VDIAFWADFYFLQDQTNFWQTDLFWHEKHRYVIVFIDLHFVFFWATGLYSSLTRWVNVCTVFKYTWILVQYPWTSGLAVEEHAHLSPLRMVFDLAHNAFNLPLNATWEILIFFTSCSFTVVHVFFWRKMSGTVCRLHFGSIVDWTNKGLFVILFQSDCMSALEKDRDYKEEHFDFIQQHIRRHCLKCIHDTCT